MPSEFRFSELENFDLVNWDPSVPRRPVYVRESEQLSRALSIPYVLGKGGSQEGLIATIINCQLIPPEIDGQRIGVIWIEEGKKNIMAPYLFFIMSGVSSTWRRPPPSLCFGDSRAADGASSIPLSPWEHGDLGVRASSLARGGRVCRVIFDLANWRISI